MTTLRTSTIEAEGQYQASKWLSTQVLLETEELRSLFETFGQIFLFMTGVVCEKDRGELSKEAFLELYERYIDALKNGRFPEESLFRAAFSSVITASADHLYSVELPQEKRIIRVSKPVLQMQYHRMHYSPLDGKFRPMILGSDSIIWGVQISYPQMFQDNRTMKIHHVLDEEQFPNSNLYRLMQRWMRQNSIPTPFLVDEKRINSPIRIGKKCMAWINRHPQLEQKGIRVKT